MVRLLAGALALAFAAVPVAAQTSGQPGANMPPTTGPTSNPGVSSQPGVQGGPSPQGSDSTGSVGSQTNPTVQQQDSSKTPGLPGSKSGPAVQPPRR